MRVQYRDSNKHEILFLENVWRKKVRDAWFQTLQRLMGDRLPDDVLSLIASLVAPSVVHECQSVCLGTYDVW